MYDINVLSVRPGVYGELCCYLLYITSYVKMIKFWFKHRQYNPPFSLQTNTNRLLLGSTLVNVTHGIT